MKPATTPKTLKITGSCGKFPVHTDTVRKTSSIDILVHLWVATNRMRFHRIDWELKLIPKTAKFSMNLRRQARCRRGPIYTDQHFLELVLCLHSACKRIERMTQFTFCCCVSCEKEHDGADNAQCQLCPKADPS